mgnify:FL=1
MNKDIYHDISNLIITQLDITNKEIYVKYKNMNQHGE